MLNIFYIIPLHYFFLKMPNISDFVKMSNFDQNCKFSRNMGLPFGEKWWCYTGKTQDINLCV